MPRGINPSYESLLRGALGSFGSSYSEGREEVFLGRFLEFAFSGEQKLRIPFQKYHISSRLWCSLKISLPLKSVSHLYSSILALLLLCCCVLSYFRINTHSEHVPYQIRILGENPLKIIPVNEKYSEIPFAVQQELFTKKNTFFDLPPPTRGTLAPHTYVEICSC